MAVIQATGEIRHCGKLVGRIDGGAVADNCALIVSTKSCLELMDLVALKMLLYAVAVLASPPSGLVSLKEFEGKVLYGKSPIKPGYGD